MPSTARLQPAQLPALPEHGWLAEQAAHQALVAEWTAPRLDRASRGEKHPVEDFLFTYYSLRPGQLARWHPGAGVVLLGDAATERLDWRWYVERDVRLDDGTTARGVTVDVEGFLADRGATTDFVTALLSATASRPAQLGCFGLHEWAMAYGLAEGEQRHEDWPLRLGAAGTDAVVEAHPVRCSHFDAFRFFTPSARPLNSLQPSRADQIMLEQPGCLHATMDLYKWTSKLLPAMPSSLVAAGFALARDAREVDMRASPYDLRQLGLEPIRIEEPAGRVEYVQAQRALADRGRVLRADVLDACRSLTRGDRTGSAL
ncbi:3-methyladenine DNA glycosylase [Angustibacter luteus]|uniref:3-methyladenine DNA glycosylase n=1 Tax=Angustibacter luteus TaxID=658456 RepID=A0ABW1JII5_9ACTN